MKLNAIMVRYIVNDVDDAIAQHLGFQISAQSGPYFALLARENFQLVLSPPKGPGGGSQPMPDGRKPEPGGWNRIIVQSGNLEGDIATLKKAGVEYNLGLFICVCIVVFVRIFSKRKRLRLPGV